MRVGNLVSLIIVCSVIFITSCTPALTTRLPEPTPQPIWLAHSPALRPALPAVQACAASLPDLALFLEETPASAESSANLRLWLGVPPSNFLAFSLGSDRLVPIAHADRQVANLLLTDLRSLFAEDLTSWSLSDSASTPPGAVQLYTYPPGNELRLAWETSLTTATPTTGFALLAADPAAMLAAVSADPSSLGYLPASWLDASVQELATPRALLPSLHLPLLILSPAEPSGAARRLIECLQSGPGAALLAGSYTPPD